MEFADYIPLCDALVRLMHPLIEVVIHDVATDTVVYINGSLSGRKPGDASLLDKDALKVEEAVYTKLNFDGRPVKSISVVIGGGWLLCINCDISVFGNMQDLCAAFLNTETKPQPPALFANDWREKLHVSIRSYLRENGLAFDRLTRLQKRELTLHLYDLGAFYEKRAADYVAEVLGLGRATVFKYLKERRNI